MLNTKLIAESFHIKNDDHHGYYNSNDNSNRDRGFQLQFKCVALHH